MGERSEAEKAVRYDEVCVELGHYKNGELTAEEAMARIEAFAVRGDLDHHRKGMYEFLFMHRLKMGYEAIEARRRIVTP